MPGAYPRRKHMKSASIGLARALPSNSKTSLERVSKDKPSSLLGLVIGDEGKKFYNIDTSSLECPSVPGLRSAGEQFVGFNNPTEKATAKIFNILFFSEVNVIKKTFFICDQRSGGIS
jgi:hypothetical protein